MKNKILYALIILSISLNAQTSSDANEVKQSLNNGTIENQFDYLIKKSGSYQEFKVIKKTWIFKMKDNVSDSIHAFNTKISTQQKEISLQLNTINELNSKVNEVTKQLENVNLEKNSMQLFGMNMDKPVYNSLLWSIIGGLVLIAVIFIFKYNRSNQITSNAKQKLTDLEEEFTQHRASAIEREQKVRRQLQDELNKNKND
ncbi:MAG: tRNA (guanine-N1)-methyltransferase [Flavobacteriaceae bacterium]|nr:MAG: tRNA (guanine-N1)-methyltransferase [Flavobacteriaceae bacterium]